MALQALFPTTANIVPYYRPIHAEKIVILQKQNFARYKYQRHFILHFNTTKFPMRLPLLPFLDERSSSGSVEPTLAKGEVTKPHNIIAKLHIVLFKAKRQRSSELCEVNDYSYKFENPSYQVKSCMVDALS